MRSGKYDFLVFRPLEKISGRKVMRYVKYKLKIIILILLFILVSDIYGQVKVILGTDMGSDCDDV